MTRFVLPRLWLLWGLVGASACLWLACSPSHPPTTCQQDAECPSGQRCEGNQCKAIDPTCRTDDDCSGGRLCIKSKCQFVVCQDDRDCNPNETCAGGYCQTKPSETPTESPRPNDGGTTESATDTPTVEDMAEGPRSDPGPSICRPNRDGKLERSEMRFQVGTSVIYTEVGSSNNPVTVDLKGTTDKDGTPVWDFSTPYPGETRVVDELLDPKGSWYATHYPDASYASILDRSLNLFGIFQATDQALLLLGTASKTANQTRLTYDKGVPLFQFPLEQGKKWTVKATASGTFALAPYRADETYEFAVDAVGKAKTPQGTFPVVRLRVSLTQQQFLPALYRRTRISYYFLSECFGIVATVDSRDYESDPLFTKAARLKRLSQ